MSTEGHLTIRQERFCLSVVKGETQSRAYELAGYSFTNRNSLDANASRLIALDKIQRRIAELQREHAIAARVTVESLSNDLLEVYRKAVEKDQMGAAVQAIALRAKLHGLVTDRKDITIEHKPTLLPTNLLELSKEEWQSQFARPVISTLPQAVEVDDKDADITHNER